MRSRLQQAYIAPDLFAFIIYDVTIHIQDKVLWHLLFADDITLIDEAVARIHHKLVLWREALESKGIIKQN